MKNSKIVLYAFIALLFCGALVYDLHEMDDNIKYEHREEFNRNYEYDVNFIYFYSTTMYYNIDINKMYIDLKF